MATISNNDLAAIRRKIESDFPNVGTVKSEINNAIQAIEDWYEDNRSAISTAIDDATTFSFSSAKKKKIGKYWMEWKFPDE
jgi:hypothetical protein